MKMTPILGVLGLVACGACGGSDEGGPPRDDTRVSGNNPIHVDVYDTIVPGSEGELSAVFGNNPIHVDIYGGTNPLYKGSVREDDALASGHFQYVLHGSDADLDGWLREGDLVVERSPAGGLTYAVVVSTSLRDIPASLLP